MDSGPSLALPCPPQRALVPGAKVDRDASASSPPQHHPVPRSGPGRRPGHRWRSRTGHESGGVSEGSSYLRASTVELSTVWPLKTYLLQTSWMWRRNGRSPASLYTRHCGTDCGSPRASRRPRTSMAVRPARPVFERWGMASSPYDRRERTRARATFIRILGVFAQG